jgi:hypothetical protein
MAEEEQEIDPIEEARRIVGAYMIDLGWARRNINRVVNKFVPIHDKEAELRFAESIELDADEHFGQAVDIWRHDNSKTAKAVLSEILRLLGNRNDISFFGKRIMTRLRGELEIK